MNTETVGKATSVTNQQTSKETYGPKLTVVGNGDLFTVLSKASFPGDKEKGSPPWFKSTKAMEVPNGVVVQVSTQINNIDGTHSVAEALTFVPGVRIISDDNGGKKLTLP